MTQQQYKDAIEKNRQIISEIIQDKEGFVDNINYIEALTKLSKDLAVGEEEFYGKIYKHIG